MTTRVPGDEMDVRYVAHLARLSLTDEEADLFQGQLQHVLDYVQELSPLNVADVEPTAHALPLQNVFRADEAAPGLPHEQVMANAPQARNGLFMVPRILE